MADVKTELINDVLSKLMDLDHNTVNRIEKVLYIELDNFDVSEKQTELVAYDDSNIRMLKKYIATKRLEGKSENTINAYSLEMSQFVQAINKPLKEINTFDIRMYLAMYQEERHICNKTLDNKRRIISSFFGWMYSEGFICFNPALAVKQIKVPKAKKKPFTSIDELRIRNACTNKRDRALVEFLDATGLRVSEVVSLNREDIDFITKESIVVGKGNKERTFYINDVCAEYLKDYFQSRTDKNDALFVARKAPYRRLEKPGIEAAIRKIGNCAGVEKAHPHRFRRTLATNMVRKGVPIQDVSTILGHADLRTTQIYVDIDQDSVKYNYQRAVA
ncbi:MAG: hypothetical protein [Bacteriophage sp.]|nr:MAG: hypothetical protein [Bacteriophage sp.]